MTRHSVGGKRLDGRLAGEVWMRAGHKEMSHAVEAYQSQHVGRCGGDDAIVRGDVVECMWSCQDGFDQG